jgi:hypothetical protein
MCVRLFIYLQIACRRARRRAAIKPYGLFLICVPEQKTRADKNERLCASNIISAAQQSFFSYSKIILYLGPSNEKNTKVVNERQEIALNYSYKMFLLTGKAWRQKK